MSNTEQAPASEPKRAKTAFHDYVDAAGNPVDIEKATGFRYQPAALVGKDDKGNPVYDRTGPAFAYQIPGAQPGSVQTMLAVFGADTLSTNTRSGAYQQRGKVADPAADIAAIAARFAEGELKDGQWATPGEGARGPKYDRDVLAACIIEQIEADRKAPAGDAAYYRKRMDDDVAYFRKILQHTKIMDRYRKATGSAVSTADII